MIFLLENIPQTIRTQTHPDPYIPETPHGRKSCSHGTKTKKRLQSGIKTLPSKKKGKKIGKKLKFFFKKIIKRA